MKRSGRKRFWQEVEACDLKSTRIGIQPQHNTYSRKVSRCLSPSGQRAKELVTKSNNIYQGQPDPNDLPPK